jgi:putative intracellular protease/amidase
MKVLLVLTSHDQLGDTGQMTGFWLEELAAPYYVFKDAGAQMTLASPKGGRPPLIPRVRIQTSRLISLVASRKTRMPSASSARPCGSRM